MFFYVFYFHALIFFYYFFIFFITLLSAIKKSIRLCALCRVACFISFRLLCVCFIFFLLSHYRECESLLLCCMCIRSCYYFSLRITTAGKILLGWPYEYGIFCPFSFFVTHLMSVPVLYQNNLKQPKWQFIERVCYWDVLAESRRGHQLCFVFTKNL